MTKVSTTDSDSDNYIDEATLQQKLIDASKNQLNNLNTIRKYDKLNTRRAISLQLKKSEEHSSADLSSNDYNRKEAIKMNSSLTRKQIAEGLKRAREELETLTALQNNHADSSDSSSEDETKKTNSSIQLNKSVSKPNVSSDDSDASEKYKMNGSIKKSKLTSANLPKINSKFIQAASLSTKKDFLKKMITDSNTVANNIIKQKEISTSTPKSILKTNMDRKILPISQANILKAKPSVNKDISYADTSFSNVMSSTQIPKNQDTLTSSDSSDSSSDKSILKTNMSFHKNKGAKTKVSYTDSSSGSDSEDKEYKSKLNESAAINTIEKLPKNNLKLVKEQVNNQRTKKSSSKESKKKISPIKSINIPIENGKQEHHKSNDGALLNNNKMNKKSMESYDSEYEKDFVGLQNTSLKSHLIFTSTQKSIESDSDSDCSDSRKQNTIKKKILTKNIPKQDSSTDSDSDSEDNARKTNITLINTKLSIETLKSIMEKKNIPPPSSSDSDSDHFEQKIKKNRKSNSDSDQLDNKNPSYIQNKISKLKSQKNSSHSSSTDSDSNESGGSKNHAVFKNHNSDSNLEEKTETHSATKTEKFTDNFESDSDSSEDKKPILPQRISTSQNMFPKSSDDSSDSDESIHKVSVNVKKETIPSQNHNSFSSSDSDSEEETSKISIQNQVPLKKPILHSKNISSDTSDSVKTKNENSDLTKRSAEMENSSTSESDSEEETSSKKFIQKQPILNSKSISGDTSDSVKSKKEKSDLTKRSAEIKNSSTSDSDSEEETSSKISIQKQVSQKKAILHSKNNLDDTSGSVKAQKENSDLTKRSAEIKKSSSSDSDSSEDVKVNIQKEISPKIVSSSQRNSDSSESSSEEESNSKLQNISNKKTKRSAQIKNSSSSDSDSEEETSSKISIQKQVSQKKAILHSKNNSGDTSGSVKAQKENSDLTKRSAEIKKSSSSDSDSSEDVKVNIQKEISPKIVSSSRRNSDSSESSSEEESNSKLQNTSNQKIIQKNVNINQTVKQPLQNKKNVSFNSSAEINKKSAISMTERIHKISEPDVICPKRKTIYGNMYNSLKEFLISHPRLEQIDTKTSMHLNDLDKDEEVWLMQVPKVLDLNLLTGQKLNLDKSGELKVNGAKFSYVTQKNTSSTCLIASQSSKNSKLSVKSLKPAGTVVIHEILKETSADIKIPNRMKVQPPANLKLRHPIFGPNFKEKIDLNAIITNKLLDAKLARNKADKKLHNKKKRKLTEIKNEPEEHKEEIIFQLLNHTSKFVNIDSKDKRSKTRNITETNKVDALSTDHIKIEKNISDSEERTILQLKENQNTNKEKKSKTKNKPADDQDLMNRLNNDQFNSLHSSTPIIKTEKKHKKSKKKEKSGEEQEVETTDCNEKKKHKKNKHKENEKLTHENKIVLEDTMIKQEIDINEDKESVINSFLNDVNQNTKIGKKKRKRDNVADNSTEENKKKKSKKMS